MNTSVACMFAGGAVGIAVGLALSQVAKRIVELFIPPQLRFFSRLRHCDLVCPTLYVFARFGVADVLVAGCKQGMTAQELALEVGADGPLLFRVLRFLSILDQPAVTLDARTTRFRITGHGRLMVTAHPQGCKNVALYFCTRVFRHSRTELYEAVRTGKPGFKAAWGDQHATVWDVLAEKDKEAGAKKGHIMDGPRIDVPCTVALFDSYATSLATPLLPLVAKQPVWSCFRSIVEVGRGSFNSGALLKLILAGPYGRGIERVLVTNLPQMIDAQKPDSHAKAPSALSFVKGDFLQPLPKETMGVDAVLMKFVLHHWSDAQCLQILGNVTPCLESSGGALILVELVVPSALSGSPRARQAAHHAVHADAEMLGLGGKERTRREWDQLLGRAGFRLQEARLVVGAVHVLVARPVPVTGA